jgi:hypothetical protein
MELTHYFANLLKRVEDSGEISNAGKDKDGFYFPTRSALIQKLNMLKDLNENPRAKAMLIPAWEYVVETVPPEWLVMNATEKAALRKMLS